MYAIMMGDYIQEVHVVYYKLEKYYYKERNGV